MIVVIGLGNRVGDLTQTQIQAIKDADKIVVKTAKTSSYTYFQDNNINVDTLDYIYDRATNFSDLDTQIVEYLLNLKENKIVYCVNGSGLSDSSVITLKKAANIEMLAGIGAETQVLKGLPCASYSVYSASDFLVRERNLFDTNLPLVIYEVYDKLIAQEVKTKLLEWCAEDTNVLLSYNGELTSLPLYLVDRQQEYNYTTAICTTPKSFTAKDIFTIGDVVEIVKELRDPGGCPWDRVQTLESIRANIIEEAYELVEAINLKDTDKIIEECGDVLLQAVFSAVIAQDSGQFNLNDVTTTLSKKLIGRHTHIFGDNKAYNAFEALDFWEQAKKSEKSQKTFNDVIAGVAKTFNALLRAEKIQKIIKKTGFDFANVEEGYAKVYEELEELKQATTPEDIENECGDLMFSAVNLLRLLGISPEVALDRTTDKFIKRFDYVVAQAKKEGCSIYDCPVEKMHKWYYQGKEEHNL